MRDFLQVMFKIEAQQETYEAHIESRTGSEKILLTCVGVGFSNLSKTVT